MAEYISKAEAIEAIRQTYCPNCDSCNGIMCKACGYKDCMDIVDDVKAADVQPVKRGKWDFQGYQLFKCTNCKEIFTQNQLEAMQNHIDQEEFTFPNFCPNCGARMDGDSE